MLGMTLDQVLLLVTLIVVGVGVLITAGAAVFAFRADQSSRRGSAAADVRWEQEIRPRPQVSSMRPEYADQPGTGMVIANVGGAAIDGVCLVRLRDQCFYSRSAQPAHSADDGVAFTRVGQLDERAGRSMNETAEVLLVLAQDIEGRWWNCLTGIRAPEPFGLETDQFIEWSRAQLAAARLAESVTFHLTTTGLLVQRP
jgi:hypothetical protein